MAGLVEKREARRRQILAAAMAAFAAKGFQGAGMAEIAAAAGVAPANLYRYFRSKQEIVRAIVVAQRLDLAAISDAPAAGEMAVAAAAPDILPRFMAAVVRQATAPVLRALWLEILAEAGRNPEIAEILAADDRDLTAAFTTILRRGQAAGEIAADIDLDMTAHWLIALMDGMVARAGYDSGFTADHFVMATRSLLRRAVAP